MLFYCRDGCHAGICCGQTWFNRASLDPPWHTPVSGQLVGALDPGFYKLIKYGTADDTKIKLIRDGYSHGLADLMLERYPETVRAAPGREIEVSPRLVNIMVANGESDLLIFEAKMNLKPA